MSFIVHYCSHCICVKTIKMSDDNGRPSRPKTEDSRIRKTRLTVVFRFVCHSMKRFVTGANMLSGISNWLFALGKHYYRVCQLPSMGMNGTCDSFYYISYILYICVWTMVFIEMSYSIAVRPFVYYIANGFGTELNRNEFIQSDLFIKVFAIVFFFHFSHKINIYSNTFGEWKLTAAFIFVSQDCIEMHA